MLAVPTFKLEPDEPSHPSHVHKVNKLNNAVALMITTMAPFIDPEISENNWNKLHDSIERQMKTILREKE